MTFLWTSGIKEPIKKTQRCLEFSEDCMSNFESLNFFNDFLKSFKKFKSDN